MKLCVIGLGYVGLPLAIEFSKAGHHVIGFDTDNKKVEMLNRGESYIEDVSSDFILTQVNSQNFSATCDENEVGLADVLIIAVPTPLTDDGQPDLSYLQKACDIIGSNLKKSALIINESTSFPGTLRNIIAGIIDSRSTSTGEIYYAVAPERVDPGNKKWNIRNTPRLIAGLTFEAQEMAINLYTTIVNSIIPVESPEIAEAAKLFENSFRQVNIALVNEFALIMRALNIPVRKVLEAANTKPHGFMKFEPGIGVGGHCIPVDPTYLSYVAEKAGVKAQFIELANKLNRSMPTKIIDFLERELGKEILNRKILICGISYKPDIADLRESPALAIYNELKILGNEVSFYDPLIVEFNGIKSSKLDSQKYDLALITVPHKNLDIEKIKFSAKVVIDSTGSYPQFLQII